MARVHDTGRGGVRRERDLMTDRKLNPTKRGG